MNWTIFHQRIFPNRHRLYRIALRITGNAQDAEDVVQEVWEKVWKSTEYQSASIRNWEAWCMVLTRNLSIDKFNAQAQRRTIPLDVLAGRKAVGADPAQSAESNDLAHHVRRMIQELPEKQRLVMHLRDIEELSYEEIAAVLDISMDQVKVNLHRARKTVRDKLYVAKTKSPLNI
ncbi:MAG: RNA polymerase sigma factor [Saprospirales bacterium]|nr:RNA polymerase sigma factor [Saprospirales bacterium]